MEYGVITHSQDAFDQACEEHGLDPDNTYVIANYQDLMTMLSECESSKVEVYRSHDAFEVFLTDKEVFDAVYKHNREFS